VLRQPIAEHLADLERQLEERLQAVNHRIAAGATPHFQITRRTLTLRWTLAYPRGSDPVRKRQVSVHDPLTANAIPTWPAK